MIIGEKNMIYQDNRVIKVLKQRLPNELKSIVKKIIVYGSRVSGYATEDSDLDIIILVENKTAKIEKQLEDIVYEVMWEFNFTPIISLKVFSESHFLDAIDRGFSFYKNVSRNGLAV